MEEEEEGDMKRVMDKDIPHAYDKINPYLQRKSVMMNEITNNMILMEE